MSCCSICYDDSSSMKQHIIRKISNDIFRFVDSNRSGIINHKELTRGYTLLDFPMSNFDKSITYTKEQFYNLNYPFLKKKLDEVYDELVEDFDILDSDCDGFIDKQHLDLETIAILDKDNDNLVDIEEYVAFRLITKAPALRIINDDNGFYLIANLNVKLSIDEISNVSNKYSVVFLKQENNGKERITHRLNIATNEFIYYFKTPKTGETFRVVLYKNDTATSDTCMLYLL